MKIEKKFTPVTLTIVLETPEEYAIFMDSISSFKSGVAKKQVLTDLQEDKDEDKNEDKDDKDEVNDVEIAERGNLQEAVMAVLMKQGIKSTVEIHHELPGNSYPAVASAVFRLCRRGVIEYGCVKNKYGRYTRYYYLAR